MNKPIVTMSLRSNLPIDFTIDNKPQSALSADFKNVFNPIIKGNSIDSVDINTQKEIIVAEEELNILKLQINDQSKTELIFQKEKAQALDNLNKLQVDIKSEDLATRERATKDLPGAKVKLQEYQNHISKDYNTLRIAEEKLRFLKSKEHIIKLQTISGFLENFTIQ